MEKKRPTTSTTAKKLALTLDSWRTLEKVSTQAEKHERTKKKKKQQATNEKLLRSSKSEKNGMK